MKIIKIALVGLLFSSEVFAGNGSVIGAVAYMNMNVLEVSPEIFDSHLRSALRENIITLNEITYPVLEASYLKATIKIDGLSIKPKNN